MLTINKRTQRRFILGRQGLWPGRRFRGKDGTEAALRLVEAVQLDPLNVVARSHDIALWGRVLDYRPEHLTTLAYQERRFFDYGGALFLYPMQEIPFWRLHMQRAADWPRWRDFAAHNPQVLEQVRAELKSRGPLGNRDFGGNQRVHSYRGRKDTALALYTLWISGEIMISNRQGFDRIYDFRQNICPPELDYAASETETEHYFEQKAIAHYGLIRAQGWRVTLSDYIQRNISPEQARVRLQRLLDDGVIAEVKVEGEKELRYALHSDLSLLETLAGGEIPEAWTPLDTDTREEAVILAPLEITSARGRAAKLFDFDYVWEVYKPAHLRRWGYYTLPVLYGDRLVARLDPRLDRKSQTLVINGLWLEAHQSADDPDFANALGRGLLRFAHFVEAARIDLSVLDDNLLIQLLQNQLKTEIDIIPLSSAIR